MILPGTSRRICERGGDFSSCDPVQPFPASTARFLDSAPAPADFGLRCRAPPVHPSPRAALLCFRRECIPLHADTLRRCVTYYFVTRSLHRTCRRVPGSDHGASQILRPGSFQQKIVAYCPCGLLSYFGCPVSQLFFRIRSQRGSSYASRHSLRSPQQVSPTPTPMAARSIASATISFGLVSVPVNVYSSSESKASVSFNMLHKDCGGRLKQHYTCTKDNELVTRDNTVKGYEFAKDQYVILTPEELKALEEKATSTIDIVEFVPMTEVDRVYLEKVYYLGPDKGGDRAYRLLVEALKTSGKAALGQHAARGQQHLVLLRAREGVLVMEQLHYADEIRPPSEVPVPNGDVKDAELKLAMMLIDQTANETFEPTKYKDTVRERVLETIQRKVEGQDITTDVAPSNGGDKILDLMEALKASLAKKSTPEKSERRKQKAS